MYVSKYIVNRLATEGGEPYLYAKYKCKYTTFVYIFNPKSFKII